MFGVAAGEAGEDFFEQVTIKRSIVRIKTVIKNFFILNLQFYLSNIPNAEFQIPNRTYG